MKVRKEQYIYLLILCVCLFFILYTLFRHNSVERFQNNIPYTIYQYWDSTDLPYHMRQTMEDNIKNNPEFTFKIYNNEMCRLFIKNNFDTSVLKAYNLLKPAAYKCDLWRLCILYIYGGIYLDIKFKIMLHLDSYLNNFKTNSLYVKDLGENDILNGIIISAPNNLLFKKAIDEIVENVNNRFYGSGPLDITGPHLLGRVFNKYGFDKNEIQFGFEPDLPVFKIYELKNKENVIFQEYDKYRFERDSRSKHYSIMWEERDIYN